MNTCRKSFIALFVVIASPFFAITTNAQSLAKVYLKITDNKGQPLINKVLFISSKNNGVYTCQSNSQGLGSINLPINDSYIVKLNNLPNLDTIRIPDDSLYQLNYKITVMTGSGQNCTLKLVVKNIAGNPLKNEKAFLKENNSKSVVTTVTDSTGAAFFMTKSGSSYILEYKNAPDYDLINIPAECGGEFEYSSVFEGSVYPLHPSRTMCLVNLYYYNIDSVPLPDETFIISSRTSTRQYQARTDRNGLAQVLVPIGASYEISTYSLNNFAKFDVLPIKSRNIIEYRHYFVSTIEYNKRVAEKEKSAALRDLIFNVEQKKMKDAESRKRIEFEKEILESNYFNVYDKQEVVKKRMEKKAIYTKERLKQDPGFFEKTKRSILATFYRFKNKWKDKVIVVDFTGSMDPYIDETLLWFKLNLVNAESKIYLFFNDGDRIYSDSEKKIGSTGGFHYVLDNSFENILDTLKTARLLSPTMGAEIAENDIEALISAQKKMKPGSELILIADNYSPARDIELLEQVKYPVRVILCGVEDKINEDYLEVAYRTGGSIHTIEEDLMNLSSAVNGSEVTINNNVYKILDGRFVWIRKSKPKNLSQ
jgi:hypothetical protein